MVFVALLVGLVGTCTLAFGALLGFLSLGYSDTDAITLSGLLLILGISGIFWFGVLASRQR